PVLVDEEHGPSVALEDRGARHEDPIREPASVECDLCEHPWKDHAIGVGDHDGDLRGPAGLIDDRVDGLDPAFETPARECGEGDACFAAGGEESDLALEYVDLDLDRVQVDDSHQFVAGTDPLARDDLDA